MTTILRPEHERELVLVQGRPRWYVRPTAAWRVVATNRSAIHYRVWGRHATFARWAARRNLRPACGHLVRLRWK